MAKTEGLNEMTFAVVGEPTGAMQRWFVEGLAAKMVERGHIQTDMNGHQPRIVLNLITEADPRPFRRQSQSIYVASVVVASSEPPGHVLQSAYPLLVRSLSNLIIYIVPLADETIDAYLVSLEQAHPKVSNRDLSDDQFFTRLYEKLKPKATSTLVIDNVFVPDLPPELWHGTPVTEQIYRAGKTLAALNLLPSVVPLKDILSERELRHVWRLFRIGGLSYGNVSARHDETTFWMSASGVDKSNLRTVGEHMHLVKGYDPKKNAIIVSVPPYVKRPNRVSVDAIEHCMIYQENPEVGAVVHAHCWLDSTKPLSPDYTMRITDEAYPCGTRELAYATASVVREAPDPTRTVIGQKNHGLVITGRDLNDIFERIESGALPIVTQIPMM